jgi:hypothetical protein
VGSPVHGHRLRLRLRLRAGRRDLPMCERCGGGTTGPRPSHWRVVGLLSSEAFSLQTANARLCCVQSAAAEPVGGVGMMEAGVQTAVVKAMAVVIQQLVGKMTESDNHPSTHPSWFSMRAFFFSFFFFSLSFRRDPAARSSPLLTRPGRSWQPNAPHLLHTHRSIGTADWTGRPRDIVA